MIHSMTGFGKAEASSESLKITAEIRSLNSKQADIGLRMPTEFRQEEMEIRKMVAQSLIRGKIDVFIIVEHLIDTPQLTFNASLLQQYWSQIQELVETTQVPMPLDPFRTMISFPGVTRSSNLEDEATAGSSQLLLTVTRNAIEQLQEFRRQEGEALAVVFLENIDAIEALLAMTKPYEDERIQEIRTRLEEGIKKYVDQEYDKNRLEQELIYYIERLDVNEEKKRLQNHLDYFRETLSHPEIGQGRKLGFIAQEIGREINTLGSKSNHAELQKIVVKMKDHLEQIKEQVLNVL